MAPTANGAVNPMSGIPFISKGLVQAGKLFWLPRGKAQWVRSEVTLSAHLITSGTSLDLYCAFFFKNHILKNHNIFQSTYRELTPVYRLTRLITEFYDYDWSSLHTPILVTLSSCPHSNLETSVVNDPKFLKFFSKGTYKQRTP